MTVDFVGKLTFVSLAPHVPLKACYVSHCPVWTQKPPGPRSWYRMPNFAPPRAWVTLQAQPEVVDLQGG